MTSVVSLDQNDLAAPVMPLMFGHPVADRAVPTVSHHTLKFEAIDVPVATQIIRIQFQFE